MVAPSHHHAALDKLMRHERGRLYAALTRRFGVHAIDLVDDVIQDACVAALESWAFKGMPDNPSAMLMRVATNKMIDRYRRNMKSAPLDGVMDSLTDEQPDRVLSGDIKDDELRLVALCCHPCLNAKEQAALSLKLVSGFTARDVATVFLTNPATIGQRLSRAMKKLRERGEGCQQPDTLFDVKARMPAIQQCLYLLFSLGYAPRFGDALIREELCREAFRLVCALIEKTLGYREENHALAALFAFQLARFPARENNEGALVLMRDQDRSIWDGSLIATGHQLLQVARAAKTPTPYHIEAAIAGCHVAAATWEETDWEAIAKLYGALEQLKPTKVVSVNAAIAIAYAGDPDEAMSKLDRLARDTDFAKQYPVAIARAEILACMGKLEKARLEIAAIDLTNFSDVMRDHVQLLIDKYD